MAEPRPPDLPAHSLQGTRVYGFVKPREVISLSRIRRRHMVAIHDFVSSLAVA